MLSASRPVSAVGDPPTQGRKGKPEMIDLTTAPGLGADAPDQLFNRPVTR